jgi:hypothetical protein
VNTQEFPFHDKLYIANNNYQNLPPTSGVFDSSSKSPGGQAWNPTTNQPWGKHQYGNPSKLPLQRSKFTDEPPSDEWGSPTGGENVQPTFFYCTFHQPEMTYDKTNQWPMGPGTVSDVSLPGSK